VIQRKGHYRAILPRGGPREGAPWTTAGWPAVLTSLQPGKQRYPPFLPRSEARAICI
jgi:hypothetical protein